MAACIERTRRRRFLIAWNLARQLRVAKLIRIEVRDPHAHTVLHFALAQIVQQGLPPIERFQILRHVTRYKDATRIAAIHHALRVVDPGPRHIRLLVQVRDLVHRPAMDPHAHAESRMTPQGAADFHRTQNRRF